VTPQRARTLARRLRWSAVGILVPMLVLNATGFDYLGYPLMLIGFTLMVLGAERSGWACGFEAAQEAPERLGSGGSVG